MGVSAEWGPTVDPMDSSAAPSIDWNHLPLSRSSVDRAAHRRTEEGLINDLRRLASTRVVLVQGANLAVQAGAAALHVVSAEDLAHLPEASGLWLFLGEDDDGAYLALVVTHHRPEDVVDIEGVLPGGDMIDLVRAHQWAPLRDVGQSLDVRDAGLATTAVALAAWHVSHLRCSQCGEPTLITQAGWVRQCPMDASQHYPRTDPAVIMAVVDGADRLLLGHAKHWPARRFSTLAGYVEPGEGLEAAVRREVAEESAIVVGEVTYKGSQPWPFPASLMFGFVARALTTDITVDGVEVTEAAWFTRAELREQVASGEVLLPMGSSIARSLIEDWYGGPLG